MEFKIVIKNFYNKYEKEIKKFLLLYALVFLVFNWSDISWIFNYGAVSGLASDFFNPYPSIEASSIKNYFQYNYLDENIKVEKIEIKKKEPKSVYTEKNNVLEIPKISISVPIVFTTNQDTKLLKKDLDQGVVYYPGSVLPGEKGDIVILGHSAPPNWPKVKHDWVFSDIDKLKIGDNIMVDINNRQYTYIVKKTTIIKRGQDVPRDQLLADENVLTLVSCWPPGKDYQRIAVQAIFEE